MGAVQMLKIASKPIPWAGPRIYLGSRIGGQSLDSSEILTC